MMVKKVSKIVVKSLERSEVTDLRGQVFITTLEVTPVKFFALWYTVSIQKMCLLLQWVEIIRTKSQV